MTDHEALLRAICHSPDDDTPRLIYADFLDESGEAARAEFVRAQVELARTPDWEPFAVLCRTRKLEWSEAGEPFRATLPPLGPELEWHPQAFRRGLGWRVKVGNLRTWCEIAPRLYESAPVGEVDVKLAAIRDEWRAFAAGDWVKHFRVIHLQGTSPVEAIRALCENPAACGITDIHFQRASSPGLPELVEDLLATPLGKGLKGLHFSVGYQAVDELVDAMANSEARLDRLSFHTMGMTEHRLVRLLLSPIASDMVELDLANDRLPDALEDFAATWPGSLPRSLRKLRIASSHLDNTDLDALAWSDAVRNLNALDLSGNVAAGSSSFLSGLSVTSLRSLSLRACRIDAPALEAVTSGSLWAGLVELDLRNNPLDDRAIGALQQAGVPEQLTAIHVDEPFAAALAGTFGDRIRAVSSEG
jgi:uncharacterized protein (TIGR02996 family)